jgi:hypothetical protein
MGGVLLLAGCTLPPFPEFGANADTQRPINQIAQAAPAGAGAQPGVIELVNATAGPLDMVFISGCGAASDGSNRLAPGMKIPPGGRRQFSVAPGCWSVDAGTMGVGQASQQLDVQAAAISRYTVTG